MAGQPVASISFPSNASQTGDYPSYVRDGFDDRYTPICFTAETLIATPKGERRAGTLRLGDLVMTRDHGPQLLRWIGARQLSAAALAANPKIRPVRICKGALAPGTPIRDLIVSPQHRILLQSKIAQRMFGTSVVLTAAKNLLPCPGIGIAEDITEVTYVHLMFDHHEVVKADGTWAESLYLGPQAQRNMTKEQLQEIETIFPGLLEDGFPQVPAYMFGSGVLMRKLVQRSMRNGKILVDPAA